MVACHQHAGFVWPDGGQGWCNGGGGVAIIRVNGPTSDQQGPVLNTAMLAFYI